ncbi:MAG: M56 family metallopeptidase [Pseudoclavibacter sp.]
MLFHALTLVVLAVLLAWPVPTMLARAAWPARAPGIAMLLWQAIAVAGGLSMIGAPLCLGLAPLGDSLPEAIVAGTTAGITATPVPLPISSFLALILAAAMAGYLLAHLGTTIVRVAAQRRRHLQLLRMLSEPHPSRVRTRVIDDDRAVAYCLPHGDGCLTVLSLGLLDGGPEKELAAVVAHEAAHLRQRHDIVLVVFRAWHQALPWFPVAALAEQRVAVLIEMLADDRARAAVGDGPAARAIVTVAELGHLPGDDVAGSTGQIRVPGASGGSGGSGGSEPDARADSRSDAGAGSRASGELSQSAAVLHERVARIASPGRLGVVPRVLAATTAVALVAVPTLQQLLPA